MDMIEISKEAIKKKLEKGEVKFTYTKKDGSLREARGTTSINFIPEDLKPHGGKSHSSIPYFDLDVNEWRSIAEGQKIEMSVENMMDPYLSPNLTEEEVEFLTWTYYGLKDKFRGNLIALIILANNEDAEKLMQGYNKLVKVCRRYTDDLSYAMELREKWNKLINE